MTICFHILFFSILSIQSLATFLKRRDPRYKTHMANINDPTHKSGMSTPSGGAAAARKRAEASAAYIEQEWQRISSHDDAFGDLEGDPEGEEWECIACDKSFRSEAAWDSHERSRKHLKAVSR